MINNRVIINKKFFMFLTFFIFFSLFSSADLQKRLEEEDELQLKEVKDKELEKLYTLAKKINCDELTAIVDELKNILDDKKEKDNIIQIYNKYKINAMNKLKFDKKNYLYSDNVRYDNVFKKSSYNKRGYWIKDDLNYVSNNSLRIYLILYFEFLFTKFDLIHSESEKIKLELITKINNKVNQINIDEAKEIGKIVCSLDTLDKDAVVELYKKYGINGFYQLKKNFNFNYGLEEIVDDKSLLSTDKKSQRSELKKYFAASLKQYLVLYFAEYLDNLELFTKEFLAIKKMLNKSILLNLKR